MEPTSNLTNRPLVLAVDESAVYRSLVQQVFTYCLPAYELRLFDSGQALLKTTIDHGRLGLLMIGTSDRLQADCELMIHLRQQDCWQHIPVVVLGNAERVEAVSACYGAGANSFVGKPTGLETMYQLLDSLCTYWFRLHQQSLLFG